MLSPCSWLDARLRVPATGRRAAAGCLHRRNRSRIRAAVRYSKQVRVPALLLAALIAATACSRGEPVRRYPIRGQILALGDDPVVHQPAVTLKHEDIPGFMPAMTMGYFLKKGDKTDGIAAGDLITATLVIQGSSLYLERVRKTGHAASRANAKPGKIMEGMAPAEEVPGDARVDR